MECVYAKCSGRNTNDKLIACWLCDDSAHLKCAGFSGKSFDKIIEPSYGFRWFCWKCRETEVDFNGLLHEAKKSLADIKQDFDLVREKLSKFESKFDNMKWPAGLNSSPKRKRTSIPSNLLSVPMANDGPTLFLSPAHTPTVEENNQYSVGVTSESLVVPCISEVVEVTSANTDNLVIAAGSNISESTEMDLVVVPPRKIVFISRLSHDTSVEKISAYLKTKCAEFNDIDCNVFKFNYSQPRDIASFKIIVPLKLFNIVANESFWPSGVLVKEFVPRDRPRRFRNIDLPISEPKN